MVGSVGHGYFCDASSFHVPLFRPSPGTASLCGKSTLRFRDQNYPSQRISLCYFRRALGPVCRPLSCVGRKVDSPSHQTTVLSTPTPITRMTNAEEARHTSSLDLDAVVHLDETWYQEGYQEGGEAGRRRGRREGRAVGYVRTISRKSLMRGRLSGGFTRRGEIVWFCGHLYIKLSLQKRNNTIGSFV